MLLSLAATWTTVSSVNEIVSLLATSASVNSYASISDSDGETEQISQLATDIHSLLNEKN